MLLALWIFATLAIALWSLIAWGLHRLLTLDPRWLDDLDATLARLPFADWLDAWLPGWQELLRLALELTQTALAWVGSAAPWIVWAVWGLGALVMLLVTGGLALLLKLALPKATPPASTNPG